MAGAVYVSVEPMRAGDEACRLLNDVAVAVAANCGGAVLQGPMGLVRLDGKGREVRR